MFQHVLHLYVFPSSSSFADFFLARKIGGIGGTPTHPLQKVIQGQGVIKFYYQILTRRKRNSTARKLNQKHFKGREERKAGKTRKARKERKRTGKRQTKQRKQEQGRGRCKSNRKERGFMKRGKRKRKGKNRRSARNGSKCSPEGGSFFENLTGICETGLD